MVHDTLLPWCSYLDWEAEPGIVSVANVQHLGTRVEGRLSVRAERGELSARSNPRLRSAATTGPGGEPKDLILHIIGRIGTAGGTGHVDRISGTTSAA